MGDISIPNDWAVRKHQKPLWDYMMGGPNGPRKKRAVAVWHRRAGKDSTSLNFTAVASHMRTGVYWHMAPTAKQVKKIVWDNIDIEGRRIIDQVFPQEVRKSTNNTEMKIELKGGSIWQCVGSDNFDNLVGANPVGVVFSEYSLANPRAWDYIRPILRENGGWAIFIYTPRGRTHGFELYDMAEDNDQWFAELLTVNDTGGIITEEDIEEERKSNMPEAMIDQEYYCSFDSPLVGAYYSHELTRMVKQGRITKVPFTPNVPVHTSWDLGIGDSTAIWLIQVVGKEIRLVYYYESSGVGLNHYVNHLRDIKKDYGIIYGEHYFPHDVKVRELSSGKTRLETLYELGLQDVIVAKKISVDEGIHSTRELLARACADRQNTKYGMECLKAYHADYDEKHRTIRQIPVHDWSSHGADALRTFAVAYLEPMLQPNPHVVTAIKRNQKPRKRLLTNRVRRGKI